MYELALGENQLTSNGSEPIASDWVATTMGGLVLSKDIAKDALGDTAVPNLIANPDNLEYSEELRNS